MPLTPEEVAQAVKVYQEEFETNFPGEDALKALSQYCHVVLQSKMQKLLEKGFAFREPKDLIAILEEVHAQQQKNEAGKRPGRPRKKQEAPVQP